VRALGANGARFNEVRGNTIGSNTRHGVWLEGTGNNNTASTSQNILAGNHIGLHALGAAGNGNHGLYLTAGAYLNRIGGAAAGDGNAIGGNGSEGVRIESSNANGLLGNTIGLKLDGASAAPNLGSGVIVVNSSATVIGGYLALLVFLASPNTISGNAEDGVGIYSGSAGTFITGNRIGTDVSGGAAVGNGGAGVVFDVIGAGGVITGNVISGNGGSGVVLGKTNLVSVTANIIGANAAGTAALPNGRDGVALDLASGNHIGGSEPADRNLISGNTFCGVYMSDSSNNLVEYNLIGLNAAGTGALGNGLSGLCLFGSDDNQIGTRTSPFTGELGDFPDPTQFLSGNDGDGLLLGNSNDNWVGLSTSIGEGVGGVAVGNGFNGVLISHGSGNGIFPHAVVHNGLDGVAVAGDDSLGNAVVPIKIYGNGGLPIDLGNDGHTPNDPGDGDAGPNGRLNFPRITGASGVPLVVQGTACADCQVVFYRAMGDPSQPGGGGEFMGYTGVDAGGQWSVPFAFWPGLTERDVTLLAYDLLGSQDVSELSPRARVYVPVVIR
jgi:parallel beta-helix repeat protein